MATLELLAEQGLKGMSMDAVAARAGASKATIYRRWRSKEELVLELLEMVVQFVQPIDTGDVRNDLIETTRGATAGRGRLGQLLPRLLAVAASDPVLDKMVSERLIAPRREQMRGFVRRGIDEGDLQPDTDLELIADMLFGTVIFLMQTGQLQADDVGDRVGTLWDTLVLGMGTDKARRRLKRQRSGGA